MCRHMRMISLALQTARLSEHSRFKLGAVLTKGSHIVSLGVNKEKTHPLAINPHRKRGNGCIHAELDAIIGVPRELLPQTTIYVGRVLADGTPGIAKPCIPCQELLIGVGIAKAYYTTGRTEEEIDFFEVLRLIN